MHVKPHHPLQELLAKLLHGIACVPLPEVRRMVNRACREAVKWHKRQTMRGNDMITETWHKILCDNCGAVNWVFERDTCDITAIEIGGFVCRECEASHVFCEDDPGDPGNYVVGLEKSG